MKSMTKLGLGIGVAGVAALTAGLLAVTPGFSLFTSATAPPSGENVSAGTVAIALGSSGSSTGDALTVGATNLAPGDTVSRGAILSNSGTVPLANVTFGVAAASSNSLVTDATNGLQLGVQSCSVPWTATTLSDGGWSYTCPGSTQTVLAATSAATAITTPPTLSNLASLNPSGTDNLVVTVTLPTSAPNSMQGLSNTLSFTFSGTQSPGTPQ